MPLRAYKTEIVANNVQNTLLLHHLGCARWAFKALRVAVMPILLKDGTPDETKELIWKTLRDVYLVQQLGNYSTDYFSQEATKTQILETVEKFVEGLQDKVPPYGPFRAEMAVCDP